MSDRPPSNTAVILRIVSDIEKKLDDFETRIRALEKSVWGNALIQSIMTAGVTGIVVAVVIRSL
jgi:regulator of RNase E activity RraA